MAYAMNPDDGPPRLFRRRPAEFFPDPSTAALLDKSTNTLMINQDIWDQLINLDQHRLLRTQEPIIRTRVSHDAIFAVFPKT